MNQIHIGFSLEQVLGDAQSVKGSILQLVRQTLSFGQKLFLFYDTIRQADAQAFLRVNDVDAKQKFGRPTKTDDSGKQITSSHVGAGQADFSEQESKLGALR